MKFQWDVGNEQKCRKHGVSTAEIEHVILEGTIEPDISHSNEEQRLTARGRTATGRAVFAVFTIRDDEIRPISARYMHAKELRRHGSA